MKTKQTLTMNPDEWRDNFRSCSVRVGFQITLTRPMMEFLCATADDVVWDRMAYPGTLGAPDNWIASGNALVKRGLIRRKQQDTIDASSKEQGDLRFVEGRLGFHELTPAGMALVELLKIAGLFIEADASINKKAKRA